MTPIKFNAPWHDLKHVCVGATYRPEFYEPITNVKIKQSLQRIARETEEDYANLIAVLESVGVTVSRPLVDPDTTIMDFIDSDGKIDYSCTKSFTLIPRPPMQPRDSFLVIGDMILATNSEYQSILNNTADLSLIKLVEPWTRNDHYYLPAQKCFDAPLATVVGDTVILDCKDHRYLYDYFVRAFPTRKIKPVYIGGHNDAVYSLVKPGCIISTHHHSNYKDSFPGWTVKYIENQSWNAIPEWRKLKHSNVERWWAPEDIKNNEFSSFIDTWLTHWVGYVKETVFDVNLLQINSSTVLVNNYNKDMFDFLHIHGIDPIVVPFRHRFFWDGGLHCITNDLYREGECENYV